MWEAVWAIQWTPNHLCYIFTNAQISCDLRKHCLVLLALNFFSVRSFPNELCASLCIFSSITLSLNSQRHGLYPYSLSCTLRGHQSLFAQPVSLVCGKSWMCHPLLRKFSSPLADVSTQHFSWFPSYFSIHSFSLWSSPVGNSPNSVAGHFLLWLYILCLEKLIDLYACEYCLYAPSAWQEYGFEVRQTWLSHLLWTNYVIPLNFSFICKNGIIKHTWMKALMKVLSSNVHWLMKG